MGRAKDRMLGYSSFPGSFQMNVLGIRPEFKKNGVYPVDSDLAELMANSIAGSLLTQSRWLGAIQDCSICPIVWFTRSVDPLNCG